MSDTLPQRAVILARISDARNGDERGVTDQIADARHRAARLGWTVGSEHTHIVVENDTSAYKRKKITLPDGSTGLRTVRPGFRRALAMLADGTADGLIGYDLDRVARDPRDLEDLIDVVESRRPRIPVESVTGSLRLDGDADVTMARVMLAVANKSSRDTGRRVARSHERRAMTGEYRGGRRPFGYEPDGTTVRESEAAEIRAAAADILAGASLRSITASLRDRKVPTVTGAAWTTSSLRHILLRARNAGIAVYQGAEMGPALWPPVLSEDEWRAVAAALGNPQRRTTPGSAPRWLGSLIYRCGVCDDGMTVYVGSGRASRPTYVCRARNHLRRLAEPVDELVAGILVARLSQPDADSLLTVRPDVDVPALSREANALRARMTQLAGLFADGAIDARQLADGTAQLRGKLTAADTALTAAAHADPLAAIAGRPDAAAVWDGLDLGRRRAIVRLLLTATINPSTITGRQPDGSYFDPESIDVEWNTP